MSAGKIILSFVAALLLEGNFQYYDYKGKMPLSPGRLIYQDVMPGPVAGLLRGAGQWWGRVVHARVPVTLLPDHVMLCVPKTIEWENPAPDSPEAAYKADVEYVVRSVAKRHAQPGMTFDENRFHYDGGGWIAYAEAQYLEFYRAGKSHPLPVDLKEYHAVGSNLVCGNTTGHKDGPGNYRAYAYTFAGAAVAAGE